MASEEMAKPDDKTSIMTGTQSKLKGYDFWKEKLNSSKLILAPMVEQSELAWRLLSRRYGAELCYSPMYHASVFVRDANYRREALQTCDKDRPLIVQFCSNDPDILVKAGQGAEHMCDAIDLNLGCPQSIAKRGHYGAFLQDEWDLVYKMVNQCHEKLKVPITCKIRVFEDVEKTVKYAKMLEKAGCQLLTVHGRTREQKGINTGLASWAHIKAVRENVSIPVFANGNIQYLSDVCKCMEETGVCGVMTAEGNLHNPAIFTGEQLPVYQMAEEYLDLVEEYPCQMSYIRGHLFKLFHHTLTIHTEYRDKLGIAKTVKDFKETVTLIKEKCLSDEQKYKEKNCDYTNSLPFPHWICQPYIRPNSDDMVLKERKHAAQKRILEEIAEGHDEALSKNKLKKLKRNPSKKFVPKEEKFERCSNCGNPKGLKCVFNLCKACCKNRGWKSKKDCVGHKLRFKSDAHGPDSKKHVESIDQFNNTKKVT